ncbi:MAG: prolipoprotein diacylglyceryl transferase [Proteobacteria bacterium]|nr:prolipoprotein diacylglyceryl transferase [Pseudomonadota bacterium]
MYPVLFKIPLFGGVTVYSYGVMVAAGFVAALAWINYASRRRGQDVARAMDLAFYIILAAILGSRIMHVAVSERERFLNDPLMMLRIWEGGLVFYGGLIAALAVSLWYIRRHRMPALVICDIFSPAIALGHAIGRIGCFLAGCCYGRVCEGRPWYSVVFPHDPHTFAPPGLPLYPTQLIESAGEFVIFGILVAVGRHRRFDGQVFACYLMLYAVLRAFNELLRGDAERGFLIEPWLSTSCFISIITFAAGAAVFWTLWRRSRGSAGRPR